MRMFDVGDVANKLWVIVCAYFWWDRRRVYDKIDQIEKDVRENQTHKEVLEQKIDHLREMTDLKIESVKEDTSAIKGMLERRHDDIGNIVERRSKTSAN